jgi:hypothetical protein
MISAVRETGVKLHLLAAFDVAIYQHVAALLKAPVTPKMNSHASRDRH